MAIIGYVFASFSAFFNGSFALLFKLENVSRLQLHPLIFVQYVCIGVFLSCLLVLPFIEYNSIIEGNYGTSYKFSPWALVAGALLVISFSTSFIAIDYIGIAFAQGIWSGVAILTSYLWGVFLFKESPYYPIFSGLGVFFLMVGMIIISFKSYIKNTLPHSSEVMDTSLLAQGRKHATQVINYDNYNNMDTGIIISYSQVIKGASYAIIVGLTGGSILVPTHYVPANEAGLIFFVSFGISVMVISPMLSLSWYLYSCGQLLPNNIHFKETFLYGISAGVIWNIGNLLSILAIPAIGYAVAIPILQCSIFIAGLWGVFLFEEMKGVEVYIFFSGAFILIVGAIILSIST